MEKLLKEQSIKGVKWTTLSTIFIALIGPFLQIIKANFLTPEDFAYLAIIMVIVNFIQLIDKFGFSQAIIKQEKIDSSEYSSLLFFSILLGFFLGIFLYLTSTLIGNAFDMPRITSYLRITVILVFLGGPNKIFRAVLAKRMLFKWLALISIVKNIILLGLITVFLFFDFGVKGVLFSYIIAYIINFIIFAFFIKSIKFGKFKFYFKFCLVLPFLKFGSFVFGKQILNYFFQHIDELVIGYFLGPDLLGNYYFGKNLLDRLSRLISASFSKVLLPLFSNINHNIIALKQVYLKITRLVASICFPVFIGIAITSHLFVPVLFGEEWNNSVIVFQIFSLVLLLKILTINIVSSVFYTLDKPQVIFFIDLIYSLIYFPVLLIVGPLGFLEIIITCVSYEFIKNLSLQIYLNRKIFDGIIEFFKQLLKPLGLSLIMAVVVLFSQELLQYFSLYIQFGFSVLIGSLVYFLLIFLFDKGIFEQVKKFIFS